MPSAARTHERTHMYALTHHKMFDRAVGVTVWSHRIVALRCLGDGSQDGIVQMTREFGTYWPRAMTTVTHRKWPSLLQT
jgi:hypothetical protein